MEFEGKFTPMTKSHFVRSVTCANPRDLYLLPEYETEFEREEMIKEKCVLR